MPAITPSPCRVGTPAIWKSEAAISRRVYLGRQPILDRDGALVAFELLFRSGTSNFAGLVDDVEATAEVTARLIGDLGLDAALGGHAAGYVNVDRTVLMSDMVWLLPPQRSVLEILETVTLDEALLSRCRELRSAGFRIALDDVSQLSPRLLRLLPCVDIVKIDFLACRREHLDDMVRVVRQHGKVLLAEKIETPEDHVVAMRAAFDLFQGYHFAKPQILAARRRTPARDALLRLLVLLNDEPDIVELEAELKLHPTLVSQLLRLINSSAFGLAGTISSFREAIILIGTRQISRWAQLLLFADGHLHVSRPDPLAQLCGTRARFMELAAARMRPDDQRFADAAFITGVLSLVHVLFGGTIEDIVSKLPVHTKIVRALLERHGELGLLLNAAEAAESGDPLAIRMACDGLAILTPGDLVNLGMTATRWYDDRSTGRRAR